MIRKLIKTVIIFAIFTSIISCKEERIKVENKKDIAEKIKIAEDILNRLFKASSQGHVAHLASKEATEDMISAFEPDRQRELFDALEQVYGKFVSLEYAEAYRIKDLEATIIRFKGNFSKKNKVPEIRMTIDYTSKFSNFAIKPWNDEFK